MNPSLMWARGAIVPVGLAAVVLLSTAVLTGFQPAAGGQSDERGNAADALVWSFEPDPVDGLPDGAEVFDGTFRGFLNGRSVVEASDGSYADGRVGLWTKSDSTTCFDQVEVTAP